MKPKIGIDIIENHRLKLAPTFLKKFLTNNEIKNLETFPTEQRKIEFCAGRWAAKEAIFKVTGSELQIPYNQIEIECDGRSSPKIINPELSNIALSISHEKNYSVAVALNWGE